MKICTLSIAILFMLALGACGESSNPHLTVPAVTDTATEKAPAIPVKPAVTKSESAATTTNNNIEPSSTETVPPADANTTFKTIEWTDLIPKDDLDALLNPPDYIDDVVDGSAEDQIRNQVTNALNAASDDRYQQALSSTRVIEAMDGQAIRIPGFIVPLEFGDDKSITQFFLVPFFGACIHVPPPPPNQIIFIKYDKGLKLDELYDPFWVSGILSTRIAENDLGTSAYAMELKHYEPYLEE